MFGLTTFYFAVKVVFTKITTYFAKDKVSKRKHRTGIHIAASEGDIDAVRNSVKDGANIYAKCKHNFGNRPIHTAAEGGHPIIIEYFLQQGVSVDIVNNAGETPLHIAALYNKPKAIEYLISNKANIHKKDNCNRTALHLAAMNGSADALCLLIKKGANLNGKDRYGWSPMYLAATAGSVECIQMLLENKAICKLKSKSNAYSPVHRAAESDQIKVVNFFLKQGIPVDFETVNGYTLLHAACRYGNMEIVEYLLQSGADVNRKTEPEGATPLYFALKYCNPETAELLINNGAHLEYDDNKYGLLAVLKSLCMMRPRGYFEPSKLIIKFLLLLNQRFDDYIDLMNQIFWQPFFPYLVTYYKDCQLEIYQMKNHFMENFDISLHQLILDSFNPNKMVRYLRHENIKKDIKNIDIYIEHYPSYMTIKPVIDFNIKRGQNIITLLAKADAVMEQFVPSLPFECRQKILEYLSVADLKNVKAMSKINKTSC
ncbi:uncharacterized protein [Diabrotica undecimpunctata]|uniref:uncharacterized protein n=1 Tax=Diabrotica undecimpunctata TaxID=50387 RepID=UPI003B6367BF